MSAPFAAMADDRRRRLLGRSIAVNLAYGALMLWVARPMRARGTDIVPFEVAGTAERVDEIIDAWGPEGVAAAQRQTWLDMGYLVSYGVAIGAGCAHVAARTRSPLGRRAGALLGWGTVVAAGCDAVENASMLAELSGARGRLPALARRCALVKFGLVLPALAYALVGLAVTRSRPVVG